jgi:uncharacterized protein (TIGR02421 family)
MPTPERERDRIRNTTRLLYQASTTIRIMQRVAWSSTVKAEFFANDGRELPKVEYAPYDPMPAIELIREARRSISPVSVIDMWLERQADVLEHSARMCASLGASSFFEYGRQIYGEPTAPLRLFPLTPLQLAESIRDSIAALTKVELDISPPAYRSAEVVAADIERAVQAHFGDAAPKIQLVAELSANALASATAIKIRKDARFTDRDAMQLLHHEAFVHTATAINGLAQTDLPILGAGHPGTTRTQEGLAVFAELISGSIELDRMHRLADRVFAIQMAIDGADFLQVYRYFLDRGIAPEQSFESTRRVFRGGVMTGGAPFTKDVVYTYGLLQVTSTIRAFFASGRSDLLPILFCGKLDLQDIPALCELHQLGLLRTPRYLPPWISDPRYLLAFLTYLTFINQIDTAPLVEAAEQLIGRTPVLKFAAESDPPASV